MTSRREAVVEQREGRLETLRDRTRGFNSDIHAATLAHIQGLLLDKLLTADAERARSFSLTSEGVSWCHSRQDALIFRSFFQRCVAGTWSVTMSPAGKSYSFEFVRS